MQLETPFSPSAVNMATSVSRGSRRRPIGVRRLLQLTAPSRLSGFARRHVSSTGCVCVTGGVTFSSTEARCVFWLCSRLFCFSEWKEILKTWKGRYNLFVSFLILQGVPLVPAEPPQYHPYGTLRNTCSKFGGGTETGGLYTAQTSNSRKACVYHLLYL